MALPRFSLNTAAHCFDVQFHPVEPLLVAATIEGAIEVYRYNAGDEGTPGSGTAELLRSLQIHSESCRSARFLAGAAPRLASCSADWFAALADVETGKRMWRGKLRAAGNALLPLVGGQRFVVGDDEGRITIHDVRQKKFVADFEENGDFITDLALGEDEYSMCATSGDGTLAVYDVRKNGQKGLVAMSDFQEDEFLSLAIVRQGTKVVCGSQTGTLAIFTWGDFGDQKDRIPGHPMSVDALVKLTEDCILTGSSDGRIRAVAVHSRELGSSVLGTIGEHGDCPLESLALSPDGHLVASASQGGEPSIQVWSTARAHKLLRGELDKEAGAEDGGDGAGGDSSDDSDEKPAKRRKKKAPKRKAGAAGREAATRHASGFFADL